MNHIPICLIGSLIIVWDATVTDAKGNVYLAGYSTGGLDGNKLSGDQDFFLAKFNAGGNKLYTRQYGVADHGTMAEGIAGDAQGNVSVVGTTSAGLFGSESTGIMDYFLVRQKAEQVK